MVSGSPGWLAAGSSSGDIIKSSDGNASYVIMYIDCTNAAGYFIFSVNENERVVLSSKFYDFEGILSSIREKYDQTQGFAFLNCYPDVTDRSKITAHYLYSQDNSLQLRKDTYGLSFNADKAIMDFYLLP
ncbi:MAG: hypothetical protein PHG48_06115 [Eubacteriales bacterium]|nr:hypothetical protein [Eubacteriales bacterium]